MNQRSEPEDRVPARLLDVLIRAGLILALALLCYRVFAPFLVLMVWALILAVTLYPLHQAVARGIGERQGLAATLITILGVVLIVAPTALLLSSIGDSVQQLIRDVQHDTLQVPPPRPNVAAWPVVGKKVYAFWEKAHADLPGLVQSLQPKIGHLAKAGLAMVASIGRAVLQFIAALIIAGIIMAFGQAGDRSGTAIFGRLVGSERGAEFSHLAVATIRAVAQGVIGVAFIQAIIVGDRPRTLGRGAGRHRARARHRAGAGGPRHLARDRLHLGER
jgi:predicted PurR-regulated permease PerM